MRRFRPLVAVALAALLGACSMDKPDLRYRDSSLRQPLAVPQDLNGPQYSQAMDIPPAGSAASVPDGTQIELPPDLRAGGPSQDQGAGQDKGSGQDKAASQDKGPDQGQVPAPAPARDGDPGRHEDKE